MLLITGYPFTMDDWPPVFVDTLAEHYRIIIFDNARAGQTALPPGPLTVSAMAGQPDGLIHALHLGPADILGCSMGGMIAQALAVLYPRDLARLVLCATATGNGRATPPTPAADAVLAHPNQMLGLKKLLFPPGQQATEVPAFAAQIAQYPHFYRPPLIAEHAQVAASLAWLSGHDRPGSGSARSPPHAHRRRARRPGAAPSERLRAACRYPRLPAPALPRHRRGFFFQDLRAWAGRNQSFLGPGGLRVPR